MKKVFLIIFLFLTACSGKSDIEFNKADIETSIVIESSETSLKESVSESTAVEEYIDVFVSGHVNNPDVYTLKKGSIINEAVKMAGGFSEGACKDYVNLAKKLEGGEHIVIPSVDEVESASFQMPVDEAKDSQGVALVNINTATKEELMGLPGIGERKADSIIEYRKSKSFSSPEDIMNISGIKEAAFNKIKDKICIN